MDREKELDDFVSMLIGKDNPFSDDYVKREVRWYNKGKFNDNGISMRVRVPQGELSDYLNRNYRIDPEMRVPMFFIDGELWMSLTPMEIQSQFLAISCASGDVGVAGLGMGYAALKMAQKDRVDSVTVFEIDERVVKFFKRAFRRRKGFDKISFVLGDARETVPQHDQFDFLYVDIYQTALPDEVLTDIELFRTCVHEFPDGYHFWGQERVMVDGALGYGLIDGNDLPLHVRAYLTRWQKTPVSATDPRLADTMLSDMYRVVADQNYCEDVLEALGLYER